MNNTRRKQIRAIVARLESTQTDLRAVWLDELEAGKDEEAVEQLDSAVDDIGMIIDNLREI